MTPTNSSTRLAPWLEQAWLGRYLDGLLDEGEATWFEAYVLDKHDLLALIDADTRLRQAMTSSSASGDLRAGVLPAAGVPASESTGVDGSSRSERGARRRFGTASTWLSLAAALVLGLGIGRLALRGESANTLIANPTHVVYDTMRGAAVPPRVEQAGSESSYVLIQVAVPSGAGQVMLHMDSGIGASLTPDPNGFVNFLLPKAQLASNKGARLDYVVDGRRESRPISFEGLNRER